MCEVCGSNNGCRPTQMQMALNENLRAEDWRDIFWFMRYVYLPFMHSVVARAKARAKVK